VLAYRLFAPRFSDFCRVIYVTQAWLVVYTRAIVAWP
jgi:hypothetical protein